MVNFALSVSFSSTVHSTVEEVFANELDTAKSSVRLFLTEVVVRSCSFVMTSEQVWETSDTCLAPEINNSTFSFVKFN